MKKPSLKGMQNCGYLGHFAKDKHIQAGHNTSWKSPNFNEKTENWSYKTDDGTFVFSKKRELVQKLYEEDEKKRKGEGDYEDED